jgi:hypothetical protein
VKQIVRDFSISTVIGLVFLSIAGRVTSTPNTGGFPVSYIDWVANCWGPGNACRTYNPVLLGLDYLFWLAVALVLVTGLNRIGARTRWLVGVELFLTGIVLIQLPLGLRSVTWDVVSFIVGVGAAIVGALLAVFGYSE